MRKTDGRVTKLNEIQQENKQGDRDPSTQQPLIKSIENMSVLELPSDPIRVIID